MVLGESKRYNKLVYYVYVLRSALDKKFYIGFTQDLKRRLAEHRKGGVRSTNERKELNLIFYEAFLAKADAQRREKYFKTTKGRKVIRIILRDYFSGIV